MRKFLIALIMAFIEIVTMGMRPAKRSEILRRVRGRLVAEYSIQVSENRRILFDVSNSGYNSIKNFGKSYEDLGNINDEADTISWINSMPADSVLWDIGANIGLFSLYAASILDKNGVRVVGFEPAAANYSALNRNIELNAMAGHVVAYCVALAAETRIGILNIGDLGGGASVGSCMNGFETEINQRGENINTVFRQGSIGFSIDDFVEMFQPALPTHIKIDVDGIEAEILRGGKRTLSTGSVYSVIVEIEGDWSSDHNRELFGLMGEFGFVPKPALSPESRNLIFERPAAG